METKARYLWVGLFTLAVLAAGFSFVYWLNNNGGLAKRAFYRIRFEGSVSGLQTGAAVQFNGIRVGEVTALQLDPDDPSKVTAMIGISTATPLRADTKVGVDFQGLMGTPAISLRGGTSAAPLLQASETEPPTLTADAAAGQDLTQSARTALQHVDKVVTDNADSLKSTIGNLKTFSDALARNSDRVDGILAGLEHFAGGGPADKPKPIYDLTVAKPEPAPGAAKSRGSIVVTDPTAVVVLQTQRILARSKDGEITQLGDAQWSDTLPKLIQEKIIQSFENAGFLASVLPPVDQVTANYRLLVDLRSFAVVSNPDPTADIEFSVKILAEDGHVVGAKIFHAMVPPKDMETASLVAAFNQAFGQAAGELVAWTTKAIAS
jgi:phospholipid/cholesterol/gamma-HCH transport system substrate-binding protein